MWCPNCQSLCAGQKATHRARSITGAAATPLTGGLSAFAIKSEGWHCPTCGQPAYDAKVVNGEVLVRGLPKPRLTPEQRAARKAERADTRAQIKAGDAARRAEKKAARGDRGGLWKLMSKVRPAPDPRSPEERLQAQRVANIARLNARLREEAEQRESQGRD